MSERYQKSRELLERSKKTIPLASQTFSKSHIQYPEMSPHFLVKGRGSHVWDVDGNEYVDFINGLLPVILGYCDPDVDAAVIEQLRCGISFSLPCLLETEVSEMLVEAIPCAEMVRFGKNGSDATAGAVRVARAYTGRERVAVCGYHGWQDWYIGSTPRNQGVPECVSRLTHSFRYNDLPSLETLFDAHPGEFAAVIMEPMTTEEPAEGFLKGVKDLAHRNGALFIFDEIITGFRFALGGAQEYFGVIPDLAAVGKSMANGFAISAVVGKREFMRKMEDVFFSFTFGGEAISLAAAKATILKMRDRQVVKKLWDTGEQIRAGVSDRICDHRLDSVFQIKGKAPWTLIQIQDHEKNTSWEIKSLFKQEMLLRGILISTSHNLSYAHSETDLKKLFTVYDEVFGVVRSALESDTLRDCLVGKPIESLFKVR